MSAIWATEVRSCPWPQCAKVVPQDKQHSWHTLHSKELSVARLWIALHLRWASLWRTVDSVSTKAL